MNSVVLFSARDFCTTKMAAKIKLENKWTKCFYDNTNSTDIKKCTDDVEKEDKKD